jgi:hypothetical protein
MIVRLNTGKFKTLDDGLILATIESAYSKWYFEHDGELEDPDKTIRLGLRDDLLDTYNKSKELQTILQYIMDYTVNKSRDIIDYIQGRKKREDMVNTDGTPLTDFDLGLLLHFNAWSNGELLKKYYSRQESN